MLKLGERIVTYLGSDNKIKTETGFVTLHGDIVKIYRKEETETGGYNHTHIEIFKERIIDMKSV